MSDDFVDLQSVRKSFGHTHALRDLSVSVRPGEVFAFIGPNGCGKTTTLRLLLGFYRADGGSVRVLGHDPRRAFHEIGPRVGVMLEQPGVCQHLTAVEYLEYYAGLYGMRPRPACARARAVLEQVKLSTRGNELLKGFSKGMRQRVSLARCLLSRPNLLLLDEPFDGVDVEARRDMLELLPTLVHDGQTSVFVTSHNLPEVERVSDRVAVVNHGRVVGLGSPEALRRQARNEQRLVITLAGAVSRRDVSRIVPGADYDEARRELHLATGANGTQRDAVLRSLLENGLSVAAVQEQTASLEEAYFMLTRQEDQP